MLKFSSIAAPLIYLTKKRAGKLVQWGEAQKKVFQMVKSIICEFAPDFNFPFVFFTDASDKTLGAILAQICNGVQYPVYLRQKLTTGEQKYSCTSLDDDLTKQ